MTTEEATVAEEVKKPAPKKKAPAKKAPAKKSAAERAKAAVAKKKPPKKKAPTEKQIEAAAAKEAAEAAKREALKKLTPIAKEIRTRIEKADTEEKRAADHRVAGAIRLAEAKGICKENNIKFSQWCEERLQTENFKFGYEQARKLAAAGEAGDEEAVALALEDMRARNAASKRKARAEASAQTGHNSKGNTTATGADKPASGSKETDFTRAHKALNELDDKTAEELVRSTAAEFGDRLIKEEEHKKWLKLKNLSPMEMLEYAFGQLGDKDKETAVEKLAGDIGATITFA